MRQAIPQGVYLVTAVDNSGLESRLPAPVMLVGRPARRRGGHISRAECAITRFAVSAAKYDGSAANFGTMRLMPQAQGEIEGQLRNQRSPGTACTREGIALTHVALRCGLRSDIYPESAGDKSGAEIPD